MALPDNLTYVTVTGQVADGAAQLVLFKTPTWLAGTPFVPRFGRVAVVQPDGTFEVDLPATDDPAWEPVNWAYDVQIAIDGQVLSGTLSVPMATVGSIALGSAMVTDAPSDVGAVAYLLQSARSTAGGVAGLDADGDVINADGDKITGGGGGGGGSTAWADITGKPSTFTPSAHASSHASAGADAITVAQSQVTGLSTSLAAKADASRSITAGTGLTGGGNLTADRSLAVSYGTIAGTAAQGNDSRLSDARTPTAHAASHGTGQSDAITVAQSQVTGLSTSLAGKSDTGHAHAGADITSGTVPIARIPTGQTGSTVPFGNDSRFTDARTPTAHAASHGTGQSDAITVAQSQVSGLSASLAAKADLASPALTGTPTSTTASAGTSTTQIATTAFATTADAQRPVTNLDSAGTYNVVNGSRIFIGSTSPTSPANGDIWLDTTGA